VYVCVGSQLPNHGGGVSSDDRGRGHVAQHNAAGSDDVHHKDMTFGPASFLRDDLPSVGAKSPPWRGRDRVGRWAKVSTVGAVFFLPLSTG
jgi:hypothetical protein